MNIYHYPSESSYQHPNYQQCSLLIDQTKDSPNHHQFESISQNVNNLLPNDTDNYKKSEEKSQNIITNKCEKTLTKKTNYVDTSNYSIEERLIAAVWIHERKRTKTSIRQIRHEFQQRFGREPPAKNTLLVWERKLFSTGSVCDAPRPGRPVNRRSRMDEVVASVRTSPALSLRARALALRVPRTTLRAIIHNDLPHTLIRKKDVPSKNNNKPQSKKRAVKEIKMSQAQQAPCPPPVPPPPPAAAPLLYMPAHDYI